LGGGGLGKIWGACAPWPNVEPPLYLVRFLCISGKLEVDIHVHSSYKAEREKFKKFENND